MSKKKNQHKGKPKHSTEQNEDFSFSKKYEVAEEEYTTVVDFENDRKYSKRLVQNNWAKYEAPLSEFECDVQEDEPRTDDFNFLLKNASSDCSHFQFSSEKLWKSDNSVPSSEIFNIDLNILSSGLACVPFYERMGLDESELSVEDKERFDREAADSRKNYTMVREKIVKKPEADTGKVTKNPKSTLEELFQLKLDLNNESAKFPETAKNESETVSKPKLFSSENDENLEDWLDSVLDD